MAAVVVLFSCSQLAVKSLSSLCLIKVNPPWWLIIQWLMLWLVPHTQWLGTFCNFQLYRKHTASRNSCSFRWKPCSWIGRAVSHRGEHLTLVNSTVRWRIGSSWEQMSLYWDFKCCCFFWRISALMDWREGIWNCSDCWRTKSAKGPLIFKLMITHHCWIG